MLRRRCSKRFVTTRILSIYANKYPTKKLIELHKTYEPITEWELRKAKLHANSEGPGVPVEKPIYHRVRKIIIIFIFFFFTR